MTIDEALDIVNTVLGSSYIEKQKVKYHGVEYTPKYITSVGMNRMRGNFNGGETIRITIYINFGYSDSSRKKNIPVTLKAVFFGNDKRIDKLLEALYMVQDHYYVASTEVDLGDW
jgi:hypothetical protein